MLTPVPPDADRALGFDGLVGPAATEQAESAIAAADAVLQGTLGPRGGRRRPSVELDGRAPCAHVAAALDSACLTVTRVAEELGLPRATLEAYRLGTRRPPAAVRAALARYLARRAEALLEHAAALDASTVLAPAEVAAHDG